jgi:hypothetical protein
LVQSIVLKKRRYVNFWVEAPGLFFIPPKKLHLNMKQYVIVFAEKYTTRLVRQPLRGEGRGGGELGCDLVK